LQSQFLERHLQEPEILKRLANNKEGQVIPDELIKKLQDSTSIADGMWTISQISLARAFVNSAYLAKPWKLMIDWMAIAAL